MNYIVAFIIAAQIVLIKSAELPSNFKTCHRNSPTFLQCVSTATTEAVISMAPGLKSFKILPLDPLQAGDVTIGENGGAVAVKQIYKNAKLYGLTKGLKIIYHSIDFDKLILRSTSYNDKLEFAADYIMDGRILLLPINGKGQSNITMLDLSTENTIHCEKYEKNGETYLRVLKYENKIKPAKVKLNFTNLFNGNAERSKQMNDFLNENADIIFNESKGEYEEVFGLIFTKLANDIFSRVPMNKIFPE